MTGTDASLCRPPFKRGKVTPERHLLLQEWLKENEQEQQHQQHLSHTLSKKCPQATSPWSSTLSPSQRKCWAKLLQQRQTAVPSLVDLGHLPEDVLLRICTFLDVPSLVHMQCVNRKYLRLCQRNEAGWEGHCLDLWRKKVHVSPTARNMGYRATGITEDEDDTNPPPPPPNEDKDRLLYKAYRYSIQDAHERHAISRKELCFDPVTKRGTIFSFRFKQSAGAEWTETDPWYEGEQCRRMVFLSDGTVQEYIPGTGALRHPRMRATRRVTPPPRPPRRDQEEEEEEEENDNDANAPQEMADPPLIMTWRFLTRPMDLPARPEGSYIRISVGGRDVPTYSVRRSPTGNWGFIMESCWGLFASFALPPRYHYAFPVVRRRPDATMQAVHEWVWNHEPVPELDPNAHSTQEEDREISFYDVDESLATVGSVPHPSMRTNREYVEDPMMPLRDDSFMVITNEIQWREAFLYNVGARILPEGDQAVQEFDRAWGGA